MSSQKSAKPDARPQSGAAAINALWDEAAKTFKAICGQSLQNGDIKSFDDVQKTIEGKVQGITSSDSPHQAEWNKAKSVGLQSLEYLKLLVSVAAQGASFVCPYHSLPTLAVSLMHLDTGPYGRSQHGQQCPMLRFRYSPGNKGL